MKTIICNDFSLDMITEDCKVDIKKLDLYEFFNFLKNNEHTSCIGDKNIANEFRLKYNKSEILLEKNTILIVIKSSSNGVPYKFYRIKYDGVTDD